MIHVITRFRGGMDALSLERIRNRAAAWLLASFAGIAATALGQTVDGDLSDLIPLAQASRTDPIQEVCTIGRSGFDFSNVYVYYDVATDELYLGLDIMDLPGLVGVPGDADGDGNPDSPATNASCVSPPFRDEDGVGPAEEYAFLIDTNHNGTSTDFEDVRVHYQSNALEFLRGDSPTPIPGATGIIRLGTVGSPVGSVGIPDSDENRATSDIEIRVDHWSRLASDPCLFRAAARAGSLEDGLPEDTSGPLGVRVSAPPTIECPDDVTVEVRDVNSPVFFSPEANDSCNPDLIVQCSPPSGSLLPPGCTPVLCVAMDPSGDSAQCEFEACVVPCVSFDLTGAGAVPQGTVISTQYQPLGLHVDALSDTGLPGAVTGRTGPPGSTTDDLLPVVGPNFLQTQAGDGTSDSGVITFTFVDPDTAEPRTSPYARLTFIDVESSGSVATGGSGRSRLEAYDDEGHLIATVPVPVGPNGGHFTAQIGSIGGPLRIAMLAAHVGSPADSAAVDELCYFLNPPDGALTLVGPGRDVPAGDAARVLIAARNGSGRRLEVTFSLYATLRRGQPMHTLVSPVDRTLPPHFDLYSDPVSLRLAIPRNRPGIIGHWMYVNALLTESGTARTLAEDEIRFRVLPASP